jgi:hypothetical protein
LDVFGLSNYGEINNKVVAIDTKSIGGDLRNEDLKTKYENMELN